MWIGFEKLVEKLNDGTEDERKKKTAERFRIIFDQIKNEEFGIEINKERIVEELYNSTKDKSTENESTKDKPTVDEPVENKRTENKPTETIVSKMSGLEIASKIIEELISSTHIQLLLVLIKEKMEYFRIG